MKRKNWSPDLDEMKPIFSMFYSLMFCTACLFIMVCLLGFFQSKLSTAPVHSMKGLAASVSDQFFIDMIGMEVPHLKRSGEASTFSQKNMAFFLFQFLTNINPSDPKTLMAREVPGMANESSVLLYRGSSTNFYTPVEIIPPANLWERQPEGPHVPVPPAGQPEGQEPPAGGGESTPQERTTNGNKVVFIYHSHNQESWIPEMRQIPRYENIENPDLAFHPTLNITLVGKRLADQLEERGIGAAHSDTDYPSSVEDFKYHYSYTYSEKTVREAFISHPDLTFVFDLHRDAQPRERTTVTIDGKDYAQVMFVIGGRNPNWEENFEFAKTLHMKLEEKYPGLCRPIFAKSSHGNAEYNQSLSPNSVLVEIGGPYNTLEESYRTADALAEIIAELYWQAEEVGTGEPSSTRAA